MKLPNGIPTLRAIRANKAPMTRSAIAAAIGTETKNLAGTLRTLAAMGLICDVERVPPRPTYAPLVGLTDAGSVAADTGVLPNVPRLAKPKRAQAKRKAKPSPVPAVVARVLSCFDDPPVPVKPKGPDPRLAHRAPVPDPPKREEPAPVSGVRLAAPVKSRGVVHPPIPQPAPRPDGCSPDRWRLLSTPLPSPLHDACARGTA